MPETLAHLGMSRNWRSSARLTIVLVSGFSVALLSGCFGPGKVDREVLSQIVHCPDRSRCQVPIRSVTSFDWDEVYAFNGATTESERDSALGIKDEGFLEFLPQLVFTKNGRIVYQESEPSDVEHPIKDELIFERPDSTRYAVYSSGAVFSARQETGPEGSYYILKQVQ